MFHLIFGLPAFYVVSRVVWPLPWPLAARLAVAVLLFAASQYHLWSRLSSGSVFAPEFPRAVVLLFNWAFGALVLLAVMQLALDLVALLTRVLPGGGWSVSTPWRYGSSAAAMLLAAVAVQQAARVPPLNDVEVRVENLPSAFDGYRILQLTDLHISRLFPASWSRDVVDRANGLDAELVVVTGDLIDGSVDVRRADVEPLGDLRAQDGVWVVPGNHEYFFGYEAWMRHYADLSMRALENAHTVLRRGDAAVTLAGVTDLSAPHTGRPGPDLDAALAGAPSNAPVILLDHQPRNARAAAARGVALQLSGHTHGGTILGFDRVFALANAGFVSGAYPVGAMTLYVNNGTGLWPGFALRLGRPSELTRITLRPARPGTGPKVEQSSAATDRRSPATLVGTPS